MIEDQIQNLREQAQQIRQSQAQWSSCQDGSYEMALDQCGYYTIVEKIRSLEAELQARASVRPSVQ